MVRIDNNLIELSKQVEEEIKEEIKKVDSDCMYNSLKVLNAFQHNRISDVHFGTTTGYGYGDVGRDTIEKVLEACYDNQVKVVSLYAFSTENWSRPKDEIDAIFDLLRSFLKKYSKKLKEETEKWLKEKGIISGYLFLNRFGERITVRGISQQLKNYAHKYGLNPKVVYPHSFRHRFAKNFLEKFNDISLLADLMGHESIETTRIYLRKTSSEQQAIVDKVVTW